MYDVFLNMNGSDSLLIVAPVSYMMELLTIEAALEIDILEYTDYIF
jgi:hypothetical protein